ncbi:hypothetical protein O181_125323, partial [Austropuccinia psidii MF-1]|nr:hypothetical protein [Austropuccinia psidii MF-1]
ILGGGSKRAHNSTPYIQKKHESSLAGHSAQYFKRSVKCLPSISLWKDREDKSDSRTVPLDVYQLSSDYWDIWLPMSEFAYSNSDHSSTKQSLFFTVFKRDPHFDSFNITQDTPAGNLSTTVQSVKQDVKRELEVAINQIRRYADKSRESPPVFNPGDMLPPHWKSILPVFHIFLLEPFKTSIIPNRHQEPPPPITIEEEEEWEVSQILDSKLMRGKLWDLVEWKGLRKDSKRSIWDPAEKLKNCPEFIQDFDSLYPD